MLNTLKKFLRRRKFTPLNTIYISKKRILDNYKYLANFKKGISIAPVLKSNAYGHGLKEVGKILDCVGAPFFCVDSLYEAFQLNTHAKIETPILIMGYIHPKSLSIKKLPFSYAVYDIEHARSINKYQGGASVHVFVDTGMNMEGVTMEEFPEFLKKLKKLENIKVEGLMSHLTIPGKTHHPVTEDQIENYRKAKKMILEAGFKIKWFHLGGTYGLLNNLAQDCNLVRVGKAVFGVKNPNIRSENFKLKPVLIMTTKIVQIKDLSKGGSVGYDGTFEAKKDMKIAVLPMGYNDGLDRRLSNKGVVGVESFEGAGRKKIVFCKIIGLVSMNVATIDISNVKNPKLDQTVIVYSDSESNPNSISNASKLCGTIPYELLSHLSPITKREVI